MNRSSYLILFAFALSARAASASPHSDIEGFYRGLLEQEYSDEAFALPLAGLTWTLDTTVWHVDSGVIRLLEPPDGVHPVGFLSVFKMPVPVRIDFSDGHSTTVLAPIDNITYEWEFELEVKPKQVTFNPEHAVLARVKAR